jgi:hypothetical protein
MPKTITTTRSVRNIRSLAELPFRFGSQLQNCLLLTVYFFSSLFLFKKVITASLNSFGFSIIMKWPTPSHI